MLERAGRRLLVSPWFAAGAGFVIATGAVIYAPHANLDFGQAIQVIHCQQANCTHVTSNGITPLQAGGGSVVTASPTKSNPLAGFTFSYQVVQQSQDQFSMMITIHAPSRISTWKLSFVIPGARDVYVVPGQARWEQTSPNGGTASNYYGGTESSGDTPFRGDQRGGDAGSGQNVNTVQFQVEGTGNPGAPVHCSYNGDPCQFRLVQQPGPEGWSGP